MKNSDLDTRTSFDVAGFAARITLPFMVIATGVFFFLAQRDSSLYGTNWWDMYLVIVGLGALLSALVGFFTVGHFTTMMTTAGVFGVIVLILSLIFAVDPTWSFTRDWQLFRGDFWNMLWPVTIIVVGVMLLLPSFFRRQR